jgi:hypothetical protein
MRRRTARFRQASADETDVALLEIAEAAVDELRARLLVPAAKSTASMQLTARLRRAASRAMPAPRDAAADDEQVELACREPRNVAARVAGESGAGHRRAARQHGAPSSASIA